LYSQRAGAIFYGGGVMNEKKWFVSNDYTWITPSKPGCYAIYVFDYYGDKSAELIYIGTAQNLEKRLRKHEVIRVLRALTDKMILVKCKVIHDKSKRLKTEKTLINRLNPPANW